ncbi:MAG: hypothetical protein Q9217_004167 [Psora testacea]
MIDHGLLANARRLMSYLPIALYAESIRLNSALVYALGSNLALPLPLTGCVKDLDRIWHLSPQDVTSDPRPYGRSSVASLRHGNSFPLVNKAILDQASITGRRNYYNDSNKAERLARAVTVHVTYILPVSSKSSLSYPFWLSRMIAAAELFLLAGASIPCFVYGLIRAAVLLLCLATNTALLLSIQHLTTVAFANMMAIEKDRILTAAHGAALDVHVVVEDWNASNIDVIAGYSSELHALTNNPVHINRWQTVRWIIRLIGIILILQAALLASLLGSPTKQAWGSIFWLVSYLLMSTSTYFVSFKYPDMLLSALPAKATRLKPINFSGRKAALIFIATMLGTNCKYGVGRWDWMDGFIPHNERRKKWLSEVTMAELETNYEAVECGSIVSEEVKRIITQVQDARNEPVFKGVTNEFLRGVGLHEKIKDSYN